MTVFDHNDYKNYLRENLVHGGQKKFAKYLNCQPAFLSQVLNSKPHLSLEQGILATEYFEMTENESEFFLDCLMACRAGSEKLKNYFRTKMHRLKDRNRKIPVVIGKHEQLSNETKSKFYSSWKYALVHVLLAIPQENQVEFLIEKTGLTKKELFRILDFLKIHGLIMEKAGTYFPTKKRIHLDPNDDFIESHHKNFRLFTLQELEKINSDSLHFSSALALAKADVEKIKSILLKTIQQAEEVLRPSPEEAVRILNIDFFEPKK